MKTATAKFLSPQQSFYHCGKVFITTAKFSVTTAKFLSPQQSFYRHRKVF
jgi:hypothetical protein